MPCKTDSSLWTDRSYFLVLDLLRLPGRPMFQHGVEYGQKLMHTGRQGDFFGLSRSQEPFVKGFDPRVVARGHKGAHVQHGAHTRAASPNRPPTTEGPTVAIERRHANQRRDLPSIEGPQLGEFQHQRPGTHGPNPRGTLQQVVVFPPQRAGPEQRLHVIVQRGETLVEPGDMRLNVRLEAPARPREAVLLRGTHANQLLAAS